MDAAYNLARWLTRNDHDAQDVVQEAYLRAFRFWEGYHGGDARAWLLAIVRNTCFTWMQQNRAPGAMTTFDEEVHSEESEAATPETLLLQSADQALVRQALEELPAHFREVLVLRELEGLSYKEIADVAGIPLGTVMSSMSRARNRLREALASSLAKERLRELPENAKTHERFSGRPARSGQECGDQRPPAGMPRVPGDLPEPAGVAVCGSRRRTLFQSAGRAAEASSPGGAQGQQGGNRSPCDGVALARHRGCCRSGGRSGCDTGACAARPFRGATPGPGNRLQPRALVDGGSSDRCALFGSAHREALVQRQARFLTRGERPGERRVHPGWRAPGLSDEQAGRGVGLPAPPTRHQPLHLAGRTQRECRTEDAGAPGLHGDSLDQVRGDLLGRLGLE